MRSAPGGLLFETASLGSRSIEMAVAILGPQRIMLGTDYPIFATSTATEALAGARAAEGERAAIATGNAASLLTR